MIRRIFSFSCLLLLTFSLISSCTGESQGFESIDEYQDYLEDEMAKQNISALSSVIFRGEEILNETYLGLSNRQQNLELEDDHLFLIGSISKVITATALLQLHQDGLFDLDDPVNDYLPFNFNSPTGTTAITFRMLLTHTSGIADGSALDEQYYYGVDSPIELGDFLENYLTTSGNHYNAEENFHDYDPGTAFMYSNTGNSLIGLLVQEISNKNFNQYCKENIFIPLGMTNTFWRLDEINGTIVQPYEFENGDYEAVEHYTFTDYPNGGLRSTARDLVKFFSAFSQEGTSNNHQLVSSSIMKDMITPQIPQFENEMGLHVFLMNSDRNLWGHDGGEQGVSTIVAVNPLTKVGAVILANASDSELGEILAEAYNLGLTL